MKKLRRLIFTLVVAYMALWGLLLYIQYPAPIDTIRLGLAKPSGTVSLMPSGAIPASTNPQTLSKVFKTKDFEVTWKGRKVQLEDALADTATNAFIIVNNGEIIHEQYFNGFNESSKLPSYSVAKSVVSILAGQLINEGRLHEGDTFIKYFPDYRTGKSFDRVTVGELLDMSSGVAVADNYPDNPTGWRRAVHPQARQPPLRPI